MTFIGGVIAFKALRMFVSHNIAAVSSLVYIARQQFGALQHRSFPWYFNISILLSSGLLLLWTTGHPHIISNFANPQLADVAQAYALGTIVVSQLANQAVIGPLTSKYVWRFVVTVAGRSCLQLSLLEPCFNAIGERRKRARPIMKQGYVCPHEA